MNKRTWARILTCSIILLVSTFFFVSPGLSQNNSQREVYLPFIQTPSLLPHALLFIQDGQILRVEADGNTISQLTNGEAPIVDFDVSPTDDTLAYVAGQDEAAELISIDGINGISGSRQVLTSRFVNRVRWSPDGQFIAFGRYDRATKAGGIYRINATDNTTQDVELNRPKQNPDDFDEPPGAIFQLIDWSPNSNKLLLFVNPDFGSGPAGDITGNYVAIHSFDNNTTNNIVNRAGAWSCLNSTWGLDNRHLFCSDISGASEAALWQLDIITGQLTPLVLGRANPASKVYISSATQLNDGNLYFFRGQSTSGFVDDATFTMQRATIDQLPDSTRLNNESYLLDNRSIYKPTVLWAPDASGAVIVPPGLDERLVWVPANGAPATVLPSPGKAPRWAP
ncbi:MAG: hypothetical protein AAGF95_26285 [Chloroflexota bacterium]